jgi:hypothetical protein
LQHFPPQFLAPKPREKPGPKPSAKHKQMGTEVVEDGGEAGEPVLTPKPRGKPGPKPGTKRKRTETEVETLSPRKLRKRA